MIPEKIIVGISQGLSPKYFLNTLDYAAEAQRTFNDPFQQTCGPSYETLKVVRHPGLAA